MRTALRVLAVVALTGCASGRAVGEPIGAPITPYAGLPARHNPDAEGTGLLVLYRLGGELFAGEVTVQVDGVLLGELSKNEFALIEASPGPHQLEVRDAQGPERRVWSSRAGTTTYVLVEMKARPIPTLIPAEPAIADRDITVDVKLKWRKVVTTVMPVKVDAQ